MNITSVRVYDDKIVNNNRLLAFASIVIDDCFVIRNLRIIKGNNRVFVAMPSAKCGHGGWVDLAHPTNIETRDSIEKLVLQEFNKKSGKE